MSNRPGQVITSDLVAKRNADKGSKFIDEEQLKNRRRKKKRK